MAQSKDVNNLVSVENIDKLHAVIREEGVKVLFNFRFAEGDVSRAEIEVGFAPVEANPALNELGGEFSELMCELMPTIMEGMYAKLISEGKLTKEMMESTSNCSNCNNTECLKHPDNNSDDEQPGPEEAIH